MKDSYGDPKREPSFEYFNFYKVLLDMGHEVELFDYMHLHKNLGKSEMNRALLTRAIDFRPDVAMFSLYTDQFEPTTIEALREHTVTFCFFHDDTWRVEYSRFWAKYFDFFSTPDYQREQKYRELGLRNAIYFPFGCNEHIYQNLNTPKLYDVSFVGGWHPWRQWVVNRISKAGFSIEVRGFGWSAGEITQEGMVQLFNQSRVNLNLSNSASWDIRYLASSPRAVLNRIRTQKTIEQLKARMFEINGCGGFQLSYFVEGLASCYQIEREIAVYTDVDDLIQKIDFYLAQEGQRESIARAGHLRTLQDHTFASRFNMVFDRMGLSDA